MEKDQPPASLFILLIEKKKNPTYFFEQSSWNVELRTRSLNIRPVPPWTMKTVNFDPIFHFLKFIFTFSSSVSLNLMKISISY